MEPVTEGLDNQDLGNFRGLYNRIYESWLCPKMRYPPKMAVEWGIHECMKHDTFSRTLYVQSNFIQLKVLDPPRLAGCVA